MSARDGELLLLAAGQGARQLLRALFQSGETHKEALDVLCEAISSLICPGVQILEHCHGGKYQAVFRHEGDAARDDRMRRQCRDFTF